MPKRRREVGWRLRRWLLALAAMLLFTSDVRAQTEAEFASARARMVEVDLATAGIKDRTILVVMRDVPRHVFVPAESRPYAYYDMSLPIGDGQTISPPFIVAQMTQQLALKPTDKVLEIGTGSGYQAAVLSRLVKEVHTIEIVEPLAARAKAAFDKLGYANIHARTGRSECPSRWSSNCAKAARSSFPWASDFNSCCAVSSNATGRWRWNRASQRTSCR
jgi:hypothetical protein